MPVFRGGQFPPDRAYANLDKITLLIQNAYHIQFENMDAYNRFKAALGQTEVFTQRYASRSGTFKIKKAGGLGERWLFQGSFLQFHTAQNGSHVAGKLTLMLNPSRYLNHRIHEAAEIFSATNSEEILTAHLSALSPQDAVERFLHMPETAFSLDGQDNMIPARLYRAARPVQTIFDLYLGQVLAFIEETIGGALVQSQRPGSFAFTAPMQDWSVSNAEVYWEYSVSHAVSFVNGLRTFLTPQFSEAEATEYRLPDQQVQQEDDRAPVRRWAVNGNAPSLTLNLGSKDVELVIYAKDVERVRFEVRYNRNVKELLGRDRNVPLPGTVQEGIFTLLEPIIVNAQRRLARVFTAMPDLDFSERCDFQVFVEFLSDLATACRDAGRRDGLQSIIGLLASNGSIEVTPDSPEEAICRQLVAGDILRPQRATRNPRNRRRRYCLNPRYTNSLACMISAFPVSQ